jgi:hypothetical protein
LSFTPASFGPLLILRPAFNPKSNFHSNLFTFGGSASCGLAAIAVQVCFKLLPATVPYL